ncbi:MAG: hypothetical protein KAT26_04525, partial [Marinosulfonomonas sp.]|nr:hypothetical protein [Marinosulfonomonas sp.]
MPDIDILTLIAGHEIGQQIEVDVRDNSVVLRLLKQAIAVAVPDDLTEEYGDAQDKPVSAALDDTDIQKDVQYALGEPNLSTEDKVDLVTKLADMELEGITFEDDPDLDLGIGKALRLDRANRTLHETSDAEDEAAMARLMDKANEQLETTENTRRHSAFSHLRAAVAATVADRTFEPKTYDDTFGDTDEARAYRIDLADAVPPLHRQEDKDSNRTDQPVPSALAPEQPLDQDEAQAQEQPVAPEAFTTPEQPAAPEPIAAPQQSFMPEEPLTLEQPVAPE